MEAENRAIKKQVGLVSDNSIDKRLKDISSNIETVEEWKEYIKKYYEPFCAILAKLETTSGTPKQENSEKPIAIITGGQPGAGKSALLPMYKMFLKQFYNIDAVVNNADFYRFCVPGSYRVSIDFPESASEITDPVVKQMRKNLMEESIKEKQSIIIENTLGDTIAVDTMESGNVHDVWIALMAVPREESLLSDFERYIKMKEAGGVARLVSVAAHDKRYYALDKIVPELEKRNIRLLVHSRGKREVDFPNLEYDSSNSSNVKRFGNASEAMRELRVKNFKEHVSGYEERVKLIREKMEGFGMTEEENEELKKLESIIELSVRKEKEKEGEEK